MNLLFTKIFRFFITIYEIFYLFIVENTLIVW